MLALAATFVGLEALILAYVDTTPANMSGVQLGAFLGLGSLAIELECLARAYRNRFRDPAQVTFLSFFLRLAIVGPLTLYFSRLGSVVGAEAFALSYCATFFVYMCWLTWRMATAPVCYKGGARRIDGWEGLDPARKKTQAKANDPEPTSRWGFRGSDWL